jgi:hypothetical protein
MTHSDNSEAPAELVKLDTAAAQLDTTNYLLWVAGQNLPNHTATRDGRGRFVAPSITNPASFQFRSKDDALRCAAWLVTLAEMWLPDADMAHPHTFDEYLAAVRNT